MSRPQGDLASGCLGKQRWESGDEARRCAANMVSMRKAVKAYRCPFCEGWHVGGVSAKSTRRRR